MKNILKKFSIIGLIVILFSGITFAQDESSEVSDKLLDKLSKKKGFKFFLENLKFSVESQVQKMVHIYENINLSDESHKEAVSIVLELQNLKTSLEEISLENLTNEELKEIKANVIETKKEAKFLSKEFKNILVNVSQEEKQTLREELSIIKEQLKKDKREELEEIRKEFEVEKIENLAFKFGVNSSPIISKFKSGEINRKQARDLLKEEIKEIPKEDLKLKILDFKEDRKKISQGFKSQRENLEKRFENFDKERKKKFQKKFQKNKNISKDELIKPLKNLEKRLKIKEKLKEKRKGGSKE